MKTFFAGLQTSTQTSYANNGKTTLFGRASVKTINSLSVIGPPLTNFIDVQTLAGFTPSQSFYNPSTNRLYVLGPASATPTVALFNFTAATGAYAYVGKIIVSLGNASSTTHSLRGFKVYESGGLINVLISTTGSVVINGGTYAAWGMSAADFTVGGTTIFAASGSNQKAVYFLQDPAAVGQAHVATTSWGMALPYTSLAGAVNTKVWQFNGTLAASQLFSWDLANTPTVAGIILNGASAQTTLYAGTSPSAFFTMGASSNGYANNDAVVLQTGTGAVPTAFAAWVAGTAQVAASNVYFVRDLQLVTGSYYFNLSLTSGGAAITPTSAPSSFTMLRAFGISTSLFSLKTGVLSTAFALGNVLQNNSMGYARPVSSPANAALNGQDCIYFLTTTGLYMGKISDLTSLGTTWSSMTFAGVGITGTGMDITAPSVLNGTYSGQNSANDVDRFVYATNASTYVAKPYQASNITSVFGGVQNTYYETLNLTTTQSGVSSLTDVSCYGGYLFVCSSATGQRGVVFVDLSCDTNFGISAVVSPVLTVPAGSLLRIMRSVRPLFGATAPLNFWLRNASTGTDSIFSSVTLPTGSPTTTGAISNGWTYIESAKDLLSSIALGPYFQFCSTYQLTQVCSNIPAQVNDLEYSVMTPGENSDYWTLDNDNTTQGLGSPSYASFYLQLAYASAVPTLYARVYDGSGNLIFNANTSANASVFQYSINGGTSWTSLGTIPNTVGTRVRALVNPTPLVNGFISVRES